MALLQRRGCVAEMLGWERLEASISFSQLPAKPFQVLQRASLTWSEKGVEPSYGRESRGSRMVKRGTWRSEGCVRQLAMVQVEAYRATTGGLRAVRDGHHREASAGAKPTNSNFTRSIDLGLLSHRQ